MSGWRTLCVERERAGTRERYVPGGRAQRALRLVDRRVAHMFRPLGRGTARVRLRRPANLAELRGPGPHKRRSEALSGRGRGRMSKRPGGDYAEPGGGVRAKN